MLGGDPERQAAKPSGSQDGIKAPVGLAAVVVFPFDYGVAFAG
jgi:hypothetical protein